MYMLFCSFLRHYKPVVLQPMGGGRLPTGLHMSVTATRAGRVFNPPQACGVCVVVCGLLVRGGRALYG